MRLLQNDMNIVLSQKVRNIEISGKLHLAMWCFFPSETKLVRGVILGMKCDDTQKSTRHIQSLLLFITEAEC